MFDSLQSGIRRGKEAEIFLKSVFHSLLNNKNRYSTDTILFASVPNIASMGIMETNEMCLHMQPFTVRDDHKPVSFQYNFNVSSDLLAG